MKIKLAEIYLLFLKLGSLIFGGGVVILPLLQAEAVEKRHWITEEELINYYAISQIIPGINIPDVSMFIGYKLRGKSGAVAAGLGVITVPFILIVGLSTVLGYLINSSIVKSALWGIEIGTIVILSIAVRSLIKRGIVDKFTFLIFVIVFFLTAFSDVSPAYIVTGAIVIGVIKGLSKKEKNENIGEKKGEVAE